MIKLTKTQKKIDEIFKPNEKGKSNWILRDILEKELNLSNNGNCRHGIYFRDKRYIWKKKEQKKY